MQSNLACFSLREASDLSSCSSQISEMVAGSNFVKSNSMENDSKLKGWISNRGGYASMADPCVSCTTFNILAPIYKRLDKENQSCRESEYRAYWFSRNQNILDRLLCDRSSIICLQEFWLGNEELVDMYETRLGEVGYINFKLARTNNRGDACCLLDKRLGSLHVDFIDRQLAILIWTDFTRNLLTSSLTLAGVWFLSAWFDPASPCLLTAIHKDYFKVLNNRELPFNDFGDRVAQLLHVESVVPFWQSRNSNIHHEILIVNTHLLFPHNSHLSIVRLRQVYKILQFVESYQKENKLNPMPIILCGDWNGSKRGHVYKFLRSQGFVSSYDTAHQYTDSDAHRWVSHRNHHGNICGVDFIWLLNPNNNRKLLKTSWNEAVFGIIKYQLRQASLAENDAFAFLKGGSHGDYLTYSGFCRALHQLGLTGHPDRLSMDETQDLWAEADRDGNGVVDYKEFQQGIWNPKQLKQPEENSEEKRLDAQKGMERLAIGFDVKNAVLFPPEVEKGMWPDNYSLSDHARLTVVFSPRRIPCSQLLC